MSFIQLPFLTQRVCAKKLFVGKKRNISVTGFIHKSNTLTGWVSDGGHTRRFGLEQFMWRTTDSTLPDG